MTIEQVFLTLAAAGAVMWLLLCLTCLSIGLYVYIKYRKLKRVLNQRYGFWLDLWQKAEKKQWGKWAAALPILPLLWFAYQRRYRRPQ